MVYKNQCFFVSEFEQRRSHTCGLRSVSSGPVHSAGGRLGGGCGVPVYTREEHTSSCYVNSWYRYVNIFYPGTVKIKLIRGLRGYNIPVPYSFNFT